MNKSVYSTIGAAVELLAISQIHQRYPVRHYFLTQILPPINKNLIFITYSKEGNPVALVTAAWISNKTLLSVTSSPGRFIQSNEWDCGEYLFFNDFIAPFGNAKKIIRTIKYDIFSETNTAYSIRRKIDGTINIINVWRW